MTSRTSVFLSFHSPTHSQPPPAPAPVVCARGARRSAARRATPRRSRARRRPGRPARRGVQEQSEKGRAPTVEDSNGWNGYVYQHRFKEGVMGCHLAGFAPAHYLGISRQDTPLKVQVDLLYYSQLILGPCLPGNQPPVPGRVGTRLPAMNHIKNMHGKAFKNALSFFICELRGSRFQLGLLPQPSKETVLGPFLPSSPQWKLIGLLSSNTPCNPLH